MNFKSLINSLISLIVALFFVFIGIVSFMLPWFPPVRTTLSNFILEDSIMIFLFGFCFLVIGAAFIAHTFWSSRRRYYHLKTGAFSSAISETIFHDYLESYWNRIFPGKEIPCSVSLAKNKVSITADLPHVPPQEQQALIERMQHDITDIFTRFLGYRTEFLFSVSFNDKPSQ